MLASPAAAGVASEMRAPDGRVQGRVKLIETGAGVMIKVWLKGLAPGPHGFHVYEVGRCEGDFTSAGGIYNPLGAKHGFLNDEGPMAGDLPNLIVPANGEVEVELIGPSLTLDKDAEDSLLDQDGAALIVHAGADDYKSEPDGGSGARILCGVIVRSK